MLFKGSKINVVDNSSIVTAKIITVIKNKFIGKIGMLINIVACKIKKKKKIIKKKLYFGLILTTKFIIKRSNGFFLKFDFNSLLVLNINFELYGTRILYRLSSYELKNFYVGKNNHKFQYEKILILLKKII
jgi:ribosomal protein L14